MTRVAVTGAGGPAGVAVIRDLVQRGHHVLGLDADPLAAGLSLASCGRTISRVDQDSYIRDVEIAVTDFGAEVLMSTIAEEVGPLSSPTLPVATWLPTLAAAETCLDKAHFAQALNHHGVPTPATTWSAEQVPPGPWVVKPRWGRGSRDVFFVDDVEGLRYAMRAMKNPIVQQRIEGQEFTADVLVDRDGTVAGCCPRWRLGVRGGISVKGETFSDPRVDELVRAVVQAVDITGIINVQGMVTADGQAVCIEVNPRFSGGLSLSLAAGCDLVGEFLRGTLGHPIRPSQLVARQGVTMSRYFEEVIR